MYTIKADTAGVERMERMLEHARRQMAAEWAKEMAAALGRQSPRLSGNLRRSWYSNPLGTEGSALVYSTARYAKARARGFYLAARPGGRIVFRGDSGLEFRMWVRYRPPFDYFAKATTRPKGATAAKRAFRTLLEQR